LSVVELVKYCAGLESLEGYRGANINLAIAKFITYCPDPPVKIRITDSVHYTKWDSWEIRPEEGEVASISHIKKVLEKRLPGLTLEAVIFGVRQIYAPKLGCGVNDVDKPLAELVGVDSPSAIHIAVNMYSEAEKKTVNLPEIVYHV